VNVNWIEELVTDKGYHSGAVVKRIKSYQMRSYISEKTPKGRRHWRGKAEEQTADYQNRQRVRGEYGKSLLRRRGELVERSFAHCYETGGMRQTHLRGHQNILKRQLIHIGAFNLSLILRQLLGAGTPRELNNRNSALAISCSGVATDSTRDAEAYASHLAPSAPLDCGREYFVRVAQNQLLTPRAARRGNRSCTPWSR
jgi:transposase